MATDKKFAGVTVKIIGADGNAFSLLGICNNAMRRANISQEDQEAFRKEAMSGDYDHLLLTITEWFDVA